MEDALKIWDEGLKTIGVLATWPLVTLYLVLLFRKRLGREIHPFFQKLGALIDRLTALKVGGAELNFRNLADFNAKVSLPLAQAVNYKLLTAQNEAAQSPPSTLLGSRMVQPSRVQGLSLTDANAAPLDDSQKSIVNTLESGRLHWQTREQLLAQTGLESPVLDTALAALLEQDIVIPAFSPNHDVVFGLRKRVQES